MTEPSGDTQSADEAAGVAEHGFAAELRRAIDGRTVLLVLGVLGIECAFVLSYVGAFHKPTPHRVPIVVAGLAQVSARTLASLNAISGHPLQAHAVPSEAAGRRLLEQGATSGVLVLDPTANHDRLLVAGGGGAATATAVEQVIQQLEGTDHRGVTVDDVVPAKPNDAGALSGFYLVIGWLVGGYLAAALLGLIYGAQPASSRRSAIRLIAMVLYACVSGLGGALIVGPVLGALSGHLLALWAFGTLLVFTAASVTMAFEAIAGVLGIGLAVVLFVVLGNPSAGGAYQRWLLPGFWRTIGPLIPNGAGVQVVRQITYFGGHRIAASLVVIGVYAVLGTGTALGVTWLRARRQAETAAVAGALHTLWRTPPR